MIDTDHTDGADIKVPSPVEIPPGMTRTDIIVPNDVPPESFPPRATDVPFTEPVPGRRDPPVH